MLSLCMRLSIFIVGLFNYLPGNLLRSWLRTPRRLKYGMWAMLLAVPYFGFAYWLNHLIQAGVAPEFFYLVVMGCSYSALKFLFVGPWSMVLLVKARADEKMTRRRQMNDGGHVDGAPAQFR